MIYIIAVPEHHGKLVSTLDQKKIQIGENKVSIRIKAPSTTAHYLPALSDLVDLAAAAPVHGGEAAEKV